MKPRAWNQPIQKYRVSLTKPVNSPTPTPQARTTTTGKPAPKQPSSTFQSLPTTSARSNPSQPSPSAQPNNQSSKPKPPSEQPSSAQTTSPTPCLPQTCCTSLSRRVTPWISPKRMKRRRSLHDRGHSAGGCRRSRTACRRRRMRSGGGGLRIGMNILFGRGVGNGGISVLLCSLFCPCVCFERP